MPDLGTVKSRLLKEVFRAKGNFAPSPRLPVKSEKGVEIAPFYDNADCAVSFSADFELNWAWRGRDYMQERGRRGRLQVPRLLEMLESFQIPVTWATVGHLFLESCSRGPGGLAHPDLPRPPGNDRWRGDWYRHDPCTNWRRDPLWYAPDLVRAIQASPVAHEIGTHSFSHISFAAGQADDRLVRAEIEACAEAMRPFGLRPRTLVYPYNEMGHHHHELLAELGITTVRHRDRRRRFSYPQRLSSGVYQIDESMNLRIARYYDYPEKASMFLDEAKRRRAAFHLWFHPSDSWEVFDRVFREILSLVAGEREGGQVWVATMGEVAAFCEARHQARLQVRRSETSLEVALGGGYDEDRYGGAGLTLWFHDVAKVEGVQLHGRDGRAMAGPRMRRRPAVEGFWLNLPPGAKRVRLRLGGSLGEGAR